MKIFGVILTFIAILNTQNCFAATWQFPSFETWYFSPANNHINGKVDLYPEYESYDEYYLTKGTMKLNAWDRYQEILSSSPAIHEQIWRELELTEKVIELSTNMLPTPGFIGFGVALRLFTEGSYFAIVANFKEKDAMNKLDLPESVCVETITENYRRRVKFVKEFLPISFH